MTTPRHADTPAGLAQAGPPGLLARLARAWTAARSVRAQPAPLVEEIEARLLYSADPAGAGLMLAGAGAVVEQRLVDDHGEFSQAAETGQRSHELLIVGAGIEDSRTLLDGLVRDGRDIEVLVLDPGADAMTQISAALAGRNDLSAIHILSHGASGQLQLQPAADTIDAAVLAARAGEVGRWGDALRPGGDILLYGCDVAAGDAGAAFVQQFSALTGADVAASENVTGDSRLQGDWMLEFSSGRIDSAAAFTAAAQAQWHGTLETRVNTVTQDNQHQAAVAVSSSGSYVVTWTADHDQDGNNTGVFAQRFDASGNPVGGQIQVNTATQDRQETSTVGVAADGSFVVAWASRAQQAGDTDGWAVKAQRFAADGSKAGGEFLINQTATKDQWQPSISVAADGQFVVAWTSSAGTNNIYVRHYNAAGNALRGEVLASGVNSAGNQTVPSVAIAADGSYVVAWQSDNGGTAKSIFAQRFNADDTQRGAGFRVNTYDADDQTQPSVAVGANGAFVIVWTSAKQDGDLGGIYAQLYKADGSRDGVEFRVNTITAKDQNRASAAMDGAGNFTIAWTSDGKNGGLTIGVYAQRYGVGGVPVGNAFLVNTTTTGNQVAPSAAMNAGGALAIAWEGAGIGDINGVFVSSFVASNTAPTAVPDTVNLVQGAQVSSAAPGVLANDTDPDFGSTLSVAALVSPADGSVLAVDVTGVSVAGVYGSLLIKSDGSYVYKADSAAATALAKGQYGSDTFTYFVRDNNNSDASSTLTFTVAGVNDAPAARNDFYALSNTDTLVVVKSGVLSNDTDPDRNPADALTVVAVNGNAPSVGSDVTGVYGTLRVNADGSLTYVPDNSLTGALAQLVFGTTVTDTFTYDVGDGITGVTRATIQITIMGTNRAPVANDDAGAAYTVQQDGILTTNVAQGVLANDVDPDGNTLSAQLINNPTHGTLTLNGDGSFVYRPNALYYGADSFTYRASDGSLPSGTATVTIDVTHVNHDPAAAPDSAAVTAGGSIAVDAASGLLVNDTDNDTGFGDRPAVTSVQVGDTVLTLAANSSGSIVTDYGVLTVGSDGAFSYVANGAASMALGDGALTGDAFTYTISDGHGGTSTASLSIAISGVNDAPVITGTTSMQSIDDNASIQPFAGVTIADADSPAQQITVSVTLDDAARGTLSSLGGGSYDAATGTYTYTGIAADATNALRALVFTPASNRVMPGSTETTGFVISVFDGIATVTDNSMSVMSTSINDAPVITGTTSMQSIGDNASIQPFAGVTIVDADSPAQQINVSVTLDDAARGMLSSLGGGSYDAATGIYTYTGIAADATNALRALVFTPALNRVMPGSTETTGFVISVSDGLATVTDNRVSVVSTSINDAPVITGTTAVQSVGDNNRFAPFAGMTVADADSPAQQLTLRIALGDPAMGRLSGTTGSYDAATGVYVYTGTAARLNAVVHDLEFSPEANRAAPGSVERAVFSITVSDGALGAAGTATVDVLSVNDAPAVLAVSARGAQDSVAFAIVLSGSDIDGGDVSLVIASTPGQGALYLDAAGLSPLLPGALLPTSGNAAVIYFRPEAGWNGDTGFTYAAIDAQGLKGATAAVSIAVAASPPATVQPVQPQEPPSQVTPSQAPQPVEAQQAPALASTLAPVAAPAPSPAVETLAVATAEPAQPSAAPAPASAPTPPAALAATSGLQTDVALPPPEASTPAQSNQQPAPAATIVRSSGERSSQAAASLLTTVASVDAGGQALLAADLSAAQALVDGRIERAGAAARSETLTRSLDQMRDSVKSAEEAEHRIVGSSVAVGASFSVGYVIWLLRGGVLATSLLSSLPAWRFVDPLPVLARMRQDNDDDSDDSLESLVADDAGHDDHEGHQGHGDGASPLQALEPKP